MSKFSGRPKRSASPGGDKKGKSSYKAGRSFSKNKNFRENQVSGKDGGSGEKKPYERPFKRSYEKPGTAKDGFKKTGTGEKKPYKSFRDGDSGEKKSFDRPFKRSYEKPGTVKDGFKKTGTGEKKPYKSFRDGDSGEKKSFDRPFKRGYEKPTGEKKSFDRPFKKDHEKPGRTAPRDDDRSFKKRASSRDEAAPAGKRVKFSEFEEGNAFSPAPRKDYKETKKKAAPAKAKNDDGLIRLNKYLSNAGVASRRDADNLIQSGVVKVNGVVVDQLGYKIKPTDKVSYGDAAVKSERKVYLLLNKPKDYITTLEDPQDRKTVMELIKGACRERIYPVGRLDRNTTGLLLFTNDGELTTKLTHPKFGIKKVYHVTLNKGLKAEDFAAITEGVELEDGMIRADDLAFVGEGKKEIGIEIHSGRNRIVRRLFEHLGYDVIRLDRVSFAGLTKKDLPRGKHRFLTAKEISFLQMIG